MADVKYVIKSEYTGPWAALSLALPLLKKSKANDWAALTDGLADPDSAVAENLSKVVLTDEQIEVLDTNGEVLRYLKVLRPVQVALCKCGLPYLVAGTPAPRTCIGDPTCDGTPLKPTAATICPLEL